MSFSIIGIFAILSMLLFQGYIDGAPHEAIATNTSSALTQATVLDDILVTNLPKETLLDGVKEDSSENRSTTPVPKSHGIDTEEDAEEEPKNTDYKGARGVHMVAKGARRGGSARTRKGTGITNPKTSSNHISDHKVPSGSRKKPAEISKKEPAKTKSEVPSEKKNPFDVEEFLDNLVQITGEMEPKGTDTLENEPEKKLGKKPLNTEEIAYGTSILELEESGFYLMNLEEENDPEDEDNVTENLITTLADEETSTPTSAYISTLAADQETSPPSDEEKFIPATLWVPPRWYRFIRNVQEILQKKEIEAEKEKEGQGERSSAEETIKFLMNVIMSKRIQDISKAIEEHWENVWIFPKKVLSKHSNVQDTEIEEPEDLPSNANYKGLKFRWRPNKKPQAPKRSKQAKYIPTAPVVVLQYVPSNRNKYPELTLEDAKVYVEVAAESANKADNAGQPNVDQDE